MSRSEVYETRRGERVAAAEHLMNACREMTVAGAHLGKVAGDPDRPLRKEIQRIAAQVVNVVGNLAPGLLEALEADAAGGTIPSISEDPEVRAYLAEEAYTGLQAPKWTTRKVPRRRGVREHTAVVEGLEVTITDDQFGCRWTIRGYLEDVLVYAHDHDYSARRELEAAKELAIAAARHLAGAGVRPEKTPRPVDPVDLFVDAFSARPGKEAR